MTRCHTLLLILIISITFICCGGSRPRAGLPWDSSESKFFDNGVDVVEIPDGVFGQWGFQQKSALDGRVQLSDYIAVVEIRTIKTITSVDDVEIKDIEVVVKNELYGSHPDQVISLKSDPAFPGYVLIKRYESRLKGKFILFSRWFNKTTNGPDPEELGYRFHLSPASPSMLDATRNRLLTRMTLEEKGR